MNTSIETCRVCVIGAGSMGGGLVKGWVAAGRIPPQNLVAVDLRDSVLAPLRSLGVDTTDDLVAAVQGRDIIVCGLKPQSAAPVLKTLGQAIAQDQILASIMAGVSTTQIEALIERPAAVVRVMPQMLAVIGQAASALCPGQQAKAQQIELVQALFDQVGSTVLVTEEQMDAVTGLSGSGPAYVYTIIEALSDGGVRVGLPRDVAFKLAAQTVMGAAQLALTSDLHPAALKEQITSPGGTTIAGLHKLEEKGLRDALISAVEAACQRSIELGRS